MKPKIEFVIEVRIKSYGKKKIFLRYEGCEVYMSIEESVRRRYGTMSGVLYTASEKICF